MTSPTTEIEVNLMMLEFSKNVEAFTTKICEVFYLPLYRLIYEEIQAPKPHTDDMIQMLDDLGIE